MGKPNRFTAQQMADALRAAHGFVSVTAKTLGCADNTVRSYIAKFQACSEAAHESREEMKDFAEGRLFQKIRDGDTASIIFFLKTQAKDRGYIERQEVTGAGGKELVITVKYADS